ncbi:MAG: tRNA pseudouridine(55) synthase TruB [Microbacteriaceae bacterium]
MARDSVGQASPSGILLVDKPAGWTSHDVVARVRRLAGTRKVGHAGTLDPMATGLLVAGIGSCTRLLTYVVGVDKEYTATVRLGASTSTDDAEGERLRTAPAERVLAVAPSDIETAIARLTGEIQQIPSAVSAIKVDGKRAYARIRAGEDVHLAARAVTVSAFELLGSCLVQPDSTVGADAGVIWRDLTVRVECSSGTYVRALARDLGDALGVGGHLTALRRTRVGPFTVAKAAALESMVVAERLLSPAAAASALCEVFALTAQQAVDLGHGKRIEVAADVPDSHGRPVAAIAPDGTLVGIVEFQSDTVARKARVLVNFPPEPSAR